MLVVFLLHGLGSHTWTLKGLEWYLQWHLQSPHVYSLPYPVDELDIEDMVAYVDRAMQEKARKDTDRIVMIGQSMGGVVAHRMHTHGWQIQQSISIGSPLKGARLLHQLNGWLPRVVRNLLYKKPYGLLMTKAPESPPPHTYHTISMGWLWSHFDGCVYFDETHWDLERHTHLVWSDHRTIFANPRLWTRVANLLTPVDTATTNEK